MKKILILGILLLLVSGCGSIDKESVYDDFAKKVESANSYQLTGKMEILNNDEKFTYNLETSYLKDDYYKVVLINEVTGQEQIILRNDTGVYVITPSLNKSFKFDSVWPENSSQSYILSSILKDIRGDEKYELLEDENGYILKSIVNYPNNSNLKYQKVYLDKEMNPTTVEIYDSNDSLSIKVTISSLKYNEDLSKDDFELNNYIDQNECEENCDETEETCDTNCNEEVVGSLDSIIYPMYIPENTSLTSTDEINNEISERVILTFSGEKNFVLIEEASRVRTDLEIVPINGNPIILNDTIAAMSSNSMYFTRNNIDYYLVSNDLTNDEMLSVASSLGAEQAVISTK